MSSDQEEHSLIEYEKDTRTLCRYGVKCYQKNEAHRKKYKHPPDLDQKKNRLASNSKKRTWQGRKEDKNELISESSDFDSDGEVPEAKKICVSSNKTEKSEEISSSKVAERSEIDVDKKDDSIVAGHSKSKTGDDDASDTRKMIKDKFLVDMPEDFYKFYELCKEISPCDPSNAFKSANLLLVGPYDILNGKLLDVDIRDKEEYLRHWRYFYDPPEFQTVIKGNDKEGLHFGYWRDDPKENPVFVGKNSSQIDCKIKPVTETIFGAVDIYLEERLKTVTPFEKPKVASLRSKVRKFANANDIKLDKSTEGMRVRERKVVTRTFHGAGIVVPYDKKTQLGYRELVATDANLKEILNRINTAKDEDERGEELTHLEEIERLATIAADECDFGTCLELGHDLFSSGNRYVQSTAIRMFSTAYTLLNRLEFLEIVKAHNKSRKEGCILSIV